MTDQNKRRVAIVTGGASGIGFAFAQALASVGYALTIADLRNAEEAAAKLRAAGASAIGVQANVTSASDAKNVVQRAVAEFGGVDVLVNNAALFTTLALRPFEQIPDEEWMRVMEVNTLGPFVCCKAALPALLESGAGRIINIASIVPMRGTPNMAHYVASKGAVIAMTRSLAKELGPRNITVNAIAPGFTLSEGVLGNKMHERVTEAARVSSRSIPRDQTPEDLLGALLFLASEQAAFITGQTLVVDGGSTFV